MIEINGNSEEVKTQSEPELEYEVTNLIVGPGKFLQMFLEVDNF